jgi:hypothetical protein
MSFLLAWLFPRTKVFNLDVKHSSVQHHLKQIARRREPAATLGSIGRTNVCKLVATSGRYIGIGNHIIEVI